MKFRKVIFAASFLFVLFLLFAFQKQKESVRSKYIPKDMILIEGDSVLGSFYVGMHEETNIDYLTYLSWLNSVFGRSSYPEVYYQALPDSSLWTDNKVNDPIINSSCYLKRG
ncbi:MAG: hypothetical protein ACKOXB_11070 [Flavobacteriales bacterium]